MLLRDRPERNLQLVRSRRSFAGRAPKALRVLSGLAGVHLALINKLRVDRELLEPVRGEHERTLPGPPGIGSRQLDRRRGGGEVGDGDWDVVLLPEGTWSEPVGVSGGEELLAPPRVVQTRALARKAPLRARLALLVR